MIKAIKKEKYQTPFNPQKLNLKYKKFKLRRKNIDLRSIFVIIQI
jgi:hypothetical protein